MNLTYATIIVLASMIFVLSAMVGYLYWQQTRLHQNLQSLGMVVSALVNPPEPIESHEVETVAEAVHEQTVELPTITKEEEAEDEEDDRVSVEHVSAPAPAPIDVDELSNKTKSQLQDLLKEKGIPYAKGDSKSVLIELLKATA